ncbi:MAG: RDD family protein [Pseudomonadales bacterium]
MKNNNEYAGFWIRTAASLLDTIFLALLVYPLAAAAGLTSSINGELGGALVTFGVVLNYILPAAVIILFWVYKSATPGKLLLSLRILDSDTGGQPSTKQFIGRYLAYYVSMIPLMIGFIWVGIDERKQGWHDKLSGTVVVRNTG